MSKLRDPYAAPASRITDSQAVPTSRWRWFAYPLGALCFVPTLFALAYFNQFGWPSLRDIPQSAGTLSFLVVTGGSGALLIARRKLAVWSLAAVVVTTIAILARSPTTDAVTLGGPVVAVFAAALFLRSRGALK